MRGQDLRPPTNVYSLFENTAGKIVEITVGPNADGAGSRTVQVVPIANEGGAAQPRLGRRATCGRSTRRRAAAWRTSTCPTRREPGYDYFKRYFYPQAHKDAIIVDERFNGGGQIADYYIDMLRRPFISYWAMRYGDDLKTPGGVDPGAEGDDHRRDRRLRRRPASPGCSASSSSAPIVGQRTWGGLVGDARIPGR